jgi:hypothetical protein
MPRPHHAGHAPPGPGRPARARSRTTPRDTASPRTFSTPALLLALLISAPIGAGVWPDTLATAAGQRAQPSSAVTSDSAWVGRWTGDARALAEAIRRGLADRTITDPTLAAMTPAQLDAFAALAAARMSLDLRADGTATLTTRADSGELSVEVTWSGEPGGVVLRFSAGDARSEPVRLRQTGPQARRRLVGMLPDRPVPLALAESPATLAARPDLVGPWTVDPIATEPGVRAAIAAGRFPAFKDGTAPPETIRLLAGMLADCRLELLPDATWILTMRHADGEPAPPAMGTWSASASGVELRSTDGSVYARLALSRMDPEPPALAGAFGDLPFSAVFRLRPAPVPALMPATVRDLLGRWEPDVPATARLRAAAGEAGTLADQPARVERFTDLVESVRRDLAGSVALELWPDLSAAVWPLDPARPEAPPALWGRWSPGPQGRFELHLRDREGRPAVYAVETGVGTLALAMGADRPYSVVLRRAPAPPDAARLAAALAGRWGADAEASVSATERAIADGRLPTPPHPQWRSALRQLINSGQLPGYDLRADGTGDILHENARHTARWYRDRSLLAFTEPPGLADLRLRVGESSLTLLEPVNGVLIVFTRVP